MNVCVDKEASNANDHCFGRGVCEISFWSRKDSNKGKRTGTKVVLTTVIGVPILMIGGMKWAMELTE